MKRILAAAMVVAFGATAIQAATLTESVPLAPTAVGGGVQLTFDLPQFNASLGTLNSVDLTFTPTLGAFGYSDINFSATTQPVANSEVSSPNGTFLSTLGNASYTSTASYNSGPFTANAGPFVLTSGALPFVPSDFVVTPLSVTLGPSGFVGAGSYVLVFTETNMVATSTITPGVSASPGSLAGSSYGNAGGTLQAVFTYTAVPEPSILSLGAGVLGMLGLVGWRRRK